MKLIHASQENKCVAPTELLPARSGDIGTISNDDEAVKGLAGDPLREADRLDDAEESKSLTSLDGRLVAVRIASADVSITQRLRGSSDY